MHTVAPGESIADLAQRQESDPWTIVCHNRLWTQEDPAPGTVVVIPKGEAPREERKPSSVTHRIRNGETLSSIARRYGVTVSQIQQANGMNPRNTRIITGMMLKIPRRG